MRFQRILTVLDRPNRPQMALKRASRLGTDMQVEVHPVSFLWNELAENRTAYDAKQRRQMKHQLLENHHEWLQELVAKEPSVTETQVVWSPDIEHWLLDNQQDGDVILKTSSGSVRGRSALDYHLISRSKVPVWLVGHKRVRRPQTILAALDLAHKDSVHRRLNVRVLDLAADLAKASDAQLHVAYAVEVSPALTDLDVIDANKARAQVVKKTKEPLRRLLKPYDVKLSNIHFPVGPIGAAIATTSKEIGADVLVAGTCAHPIKEAVGLGNSAQRIVRKAPIDVVTVPLGE